PIAEEMGRALFPGPFLETVVVEDVIMAVGTAQQKGYALKQMADGNMIITTAVTEPSADYSPTGVTLTAEKRGDDYVLNGVKLPVAYADSAGALLVAARTGGGDGADGISLFFVGRQTPGITLERLQNIAGYPLYAVSFENASTPAVSMLGP